jgi:TonB-dependent receptor
VILGAKSELKFGGSYVYKNREFFENKFSFLDQNDSYNGNISAYFAESNIGQNASGTYGVYVLNSINDDLKNSYDAIQNSFAGYIVADMPAFGRLRLIPGIRFEQNTADVASKNVDKTKGTLNNMDILPSLNAAYSLSKQVNVRFAYTRTVSRPSFRELAPYASFDFIGSETIIGNPFLERTLIDNIDLRWENFLGIGEIIAFTLFYKRFDNPVERTFNPEAANPELTWRNVKSALLMGAEVEFRKGLGSWISALSPFLISANFTFVKTSVDIDKKELETVHVIEPNHPSTRVMTGQAPYIVNASIVYNHDASDIEANISYNVTGRRLSIVLVGGTPNIYEQPFHALNANLIKKFGDHLSVKFALNNILDAPHLFTYSRYDEKNTWRGEEYLYLKYNSGRVISFGVTWNL